MRKFGWIGLGLCIALSGCGGGGGAPLPADNTPPAIGNLSIEAVNGGVQISATVQDAETGVASVVAVAVVGNAPQTVAMTPAGANRYQATLPPNTVRVRVRATDRAGNARETGEIAAPPPLPPF